MDLLLSILILTLIIAMLRENDSLRLVVYFTGFSLLMSALYFLYHAYDVALAEIAIGSAILPLIFIIAIGKQKTFVVISRVKDDFMNEEENSPGQTLLRGFAHRYGLKTEIHFEGQTRLKGAFRRRNADLMVIKSRRDGKYIFLMKSSSVLHYKMQRIAEGHRNLRFEVVEEDQVYD